MSAEKWGNVWASFAVPLTGGRGPFTHGTNNSEDRPTPARSFMQTAVKHLPRTRCYAGA